MRFHFPVIIIDEDFRSENASGLGIRALAEAIETEGFEVLGVTNYGDLTTFAQQQSRASTFILSIDDEEFTPGPDLDPAVVARIEFARNPATTAAVITTWTASEITARTIAFRQESAVCDALPAGLRYRLMLTVPQTGDDLDICLAVGNVHRIQ